MKTNNKNIILTVVLLLCLNLQGFAQKTITVLQTGDTHSRIEVIDENSQDKYAGMGGYARRMELIDEMRKKDPGLLLFDCGDFSQGTPYYNMFQGEVEIKLMNLLKYDAVLIGNHEFDYGMDNLARLFRMANFPIVCSNYKVEGTVLNGLVKPYVIFEREGVKIGVIGVSPELAGLVPADKCQGVIYEDPIPVANRIATELKTKEKCDVVICLSHLGYGTDKKFIAESVDIDVVLGSHSHTLLEKPETYLNSQNQDVTLFHTYKNGVFVGELKLNLE